MGRIVPEDKRQACGAMPVDFFTMLASCIVVNGQGVAYLNTICPESNDCADYEPLIDCDLGAPVNPEAFVVANAFALDECGRLALKIVGCSTLEFGPE